MMQGQQKIKAWMIGIAALLVIYMGWSEYKRRMAIETLLSVALTVMRDEVGAHDWVWNTELKLALGQDQVCVQNGEILAHPVRTAQFKSVEPVVGDPEVPACCFHLAKPQQILRPGKSVPAVYRSDLPNVIRYVIASRSYGSNENTFPECEGKNDPDCMSRVQDHRIGEGVSSLEVSFEAGSAFDRVECRWKVHTGQTVKKIRKQLDSESMFPKEIQKILGDQATLVRR